MEYFTQVVGTVRMKKDMMQFVCQKIMMIQQEN